MANRYWINDTGDYNDTSHWSTSSGGGGGASVPGSGDNAVFDANSFSAAGKTVTINAVNLACFNFDWSTATHSPTLAFSNSFFVYGSLTYISSMNITSTGVNNAVTFLGITTGLTYDFAGLTLPNAVRFRGDGGEWTQLTDFLMASSTAFVVGFSGSTPTLTVNTNGKSITQASFCSIEIDENATLNLGSSVLTFNDQGQTRIISSGTLDLGSSTINVINTTTDEAVLEFDSGILIGGTSTINFDGDNILIFNSTGGELVFNNLTMGNTPTTPDYLSSQITFNTLTIYPGTTIQFPDGGTVTATTINASGVSNNIIFESDFSPFQYTLSATTVNISSVSVTDCIADGSTPFVDTNGFDGGNNINWTFPTAATAKRGGVLLLLDI